MRIGLVADPCDPKTPGGLGRCIYEWSRAVIAAGVEDSFVVYAKPAALASFLNAGVESRPLPENVWLMGSRALDPSLDLYIFLTPAIPLFFRPKRAVVVAGDFAYLDLPQPGLRARLHALASYLMHRRSLGLAERVACMSEATKESAIRHFALVPQKCVVTPLAAMPPAPPEPVSGLPKRFFFFAGALKERKNVANIVRGFARFYHAYPEENIHLLLAGKTGGREYDELVAIIKEDAVANRVHFLGYVSDGQITYLYEHALALVFASLIEGFGMPILEAMRAGCPVITSDRGAVAEVAGGAALLVNPHLPEALGLAMSRLAASPRLRAELIEKGRARAKEFSWPLAARRLYAIAVAGRT